MKRSIFLYAFLSRCWMITCMFVESFPPAFNIVRHSGVRSTSLLAEDIDSACPFSTSFASKNRICLSSNNDRSNKVNLKRNWLTKGFDVMRIENRYKSEKYAKYISLDDYGDLKDNLMLIKSSALLWRSVSDLVNSPSMSGYQKIILSLPGVSSTVCNQLLEILKWSKENIKSSDAALVSVSLDTSISKSIPVMTLERVTTERIKVDSELKKELDKSMINSRIKSWVKRILVDLGICPFTKSDTMSGQGLKDLGIPVAKIAYHVSSAEMTEVAKLMADCWEAILEMASSGPSGQDGISSILLSAPSFDDDFMYWAEFIFAILEAGVVAANAESQYGVVCFHPKYATPNGQGWPGFGQMHSVPKLRYWLNEQDKELSDTLSDEDVAAGGAWQRRTPHAVINVLWSQQLAAAEGRRKTGSLYTRNIRVLVSKDGIGTEQLRSALKQERTSS